jgi:hypothetical protein
MSDDFVKVPFKLEADGTKTFFLPSNCRMGKGYEIGARDKDKVRSIQNYWNALEQLKAMNQPRFRRKNKNGIFGTVTCAPEDIEDVSREFIEKERLKHGE